MQTASTINGGDRATTPSPLPPPPLSCLRQLSELGLGMTQSRGASSLPPSLPPAFAFPHSRGSHSESNGRVDGRSPVSHNRGASTERQSCH